MSKSDHNNTRRRVLQRRVPLFYPARHIAGAGFTLKVKRPKLGVAGADASARLAAIMQAILLAQLIRRLETVPIVQTILVLLTGLIGGRQRRCRDGHDQRYDDEQKQQLFHGFLPFSYGEGTWSGGRQTVPSSLFYYKDVGPAR